MWRPKVDQNVRLHYAAKPKRAGLEAPAAFMPFEDKIGTVVAVTSARPRNALVMVWGGTIGAYLVVVPCGNLFALEESQ